MNKNYYLLLENKVETKQNREKFLNTQWTITKLYCGSGLGQYCTVE